MSENKPIQISLIDEHQRLVGGWASVQILDKQNDIVPIGELNRSMLTLMDRGGSIIYGHSNKPIGKVLQWEVKQHPTSGQLGIHFVAKIYDHYEVDDIVWEKVKKGELGGFSIGATAKEEMRKVIDKEGNAHEVGVLRDLALLEISLVDTPANPLALVDEVNYFAKGETKPIEAKQEVIVAKQELKVTIDKAISDSFELSKKELEAALSKLKCNKPMPNGKEDIKKPKTKSLEEEAVIRTHDEMVTAIEKIQSGAEDSSQNPKYEHKPVKTEQAIGSKREREGSERATNKADANPHVPERTPAKYRHRGMLRLWHIKPDLPEYSGNNLRNKSE